MVRSPVIRAAVLASMLAVAGLAVSAAPVAAYGAAEHPLAQIEFSANCNNPSYFLCSPPPAGFGLGGVWVWIEIDAGGTGDIAGAGCGHDRAGSGGAGPIRGEITWTSSSTPVGPAFAVDPNGRYYNVSIEGGGVISFPQTVGHYSFHPVAGVAIEIQIAP
jgi:hypothetical protein